MSNRQLHDIQRPVNHIPKIITLATLLVVFFSTGRISGHPLPAPAQPIAAVLGPGVSGPVHLRPGNDLFRVDVDTATYPGAIANDGTPAVFYVRRARTTEDANRWNIQLQGGGGCFDGTSCAMRWLSDGTNFGAPQMSTQPAPPNGMAGSGIVSQNPQNSFRGWNHVFIYYASSDKWQGRNSTVLDTAWFRGSPPTHGPRQYLIHFRGADILDAVIAMLRTGVTYDTPTEQDVEMPDLDDAELVLLTGSSAGGGGVIYNADRIGAHLQTNNNNGGLDYRAVVDASYGRTYPTRDYRGTATCQFRGLCSYELLMTDTWLNVIEALFDPDPTTPGISVEDDCEANEAGTEWKCADGNHVLKSHVATPVFVRKDLQDELSSEKYEKAGWGSSGDYGQITEYELRRFRAADPARGVFGPQCTHHTALNRNDAFLDVSVEVGGTMFNFNDLLSNWLTGGSPTVAIAEFQGPGPASTCP